MPGSGKITTEHTIWCGICEEWVQLPISTKRAMQAAARRDGWRQVGGRWVCPECMRAPSNAKLLRLAKKHPPPQEYFDDEYDDEKPHN
jgi:hypothetical protein